MFLPNQEPRTKYVMRREKASQVEEYEDVGGDYAHEDQVQLYPHEMSLFIDELEDLICTGARVPLTAKALVDQEQCLDTLEVLRANWPWEMLEAQRILSQEGEVLERAEVEAEEIRQRAERQAAVILDQSQLVKMAEVRAQEVLEAAEQEATQLLRRAEQDVRDVYLGLERELDLLLRDIKEVVAARLGRLRS